MVRWEYSSLHPTTEFVSSRNFGITPKLKLHIHIHRNFGLRVGPEGAYGRYQHKASSQLLKTSISNGGKNYLKSLRPYSSENVGKSYMHTISHITTMYRFIIFTNTLFLKFFRDITHPLYAYVDETFHSQAVGLVFQCKPKKSTWCVGPITSRYPLSPT